MTLRTLEQINQHQIIVKPFYNRKMALDWFEKHLKEIGITDIQHYVLSFEAEDGVCVNNLRQEAIAWIKELEKSKDSPVAILSQTNWIKHFFNISSSDLGEKNNDPLKDCVTDEKAIRKHLGLED